MEQAAEPQSLPQSLLWQMLEDTDERNASAGPSKFADLRGQQSETPLIKYESCFQHYWSLHFGRCLAFFPIPSSS